MRWWILFTGLAFALMCCISGLAQQAPGGAGCVIEKHVRTCNWEGFKHMLSASKTAAVEAPAMERFTDSDLRDLAKKLGMSVVGDNDHADLTFEVISADQDAIAFGPADRDLAELCIYAGGSSRGPLVWVETYRGQGDEPWASVVGAVILQFQDRLAAKH
jgi:hypothetical protein